jgi:hypothetical protein
MRGHEQIIVERLFGKAPEWVFINDFPCPTDWAKWGDIPDVCVAGDTLHRLDFRFLVGLKVSIASAIEARAKELFTRIKAAGACLVVAGHVQSDKPPSDQSGWLEIYTKEVA